MIHSRHRLWTNRVSKVYLRFLNVVLPTNLLRIRTLMFGPPHGSFDTRFTWLLVKDRCESESVQKKEVQRCWYSFLQTRFKNATTALESCLCGGFSCTGWGPESVEDRLFSMLAEIQRLPPRKVPPTRLSCQMCTDHRKCAIDPKQEVGAPVIFWKAGNCGGECPKSDEKGCNYTFKYEY